MKDQYLIWIGLGLTALGMLWQYFGVVLKLNTRLTRLETQMEPFWAQMLEISKEIIKQPIHFKKDDLIDRFPHLGYEEMCELKKILLEEKEMYTKQKDFKAIAAMMILLQLDEVMKGRSEKC